MDIEQIKRKYRRNARFYDVLEALFRRARELAIVRLALQTGEDVLDLGCGTGLSFELLQGAVGPKGRIIGVEVSRDMLARAREKIARHSWTNVTLIEANAEEADLEPESVDAVLSYYTHDIITSRRAVEGAVRALRPGGRFTAAGSKNARGLRGLFLNPITRFYSRPFVTNSSGTARPWSHVEDLLGPMTVEERIWGTAYIACGVKPDSTQPTEHAQTQIAR